MAKRNIISPRVGILAGLASILLIIGVVAGLRVWYSSNLRPVSSSETVQYFTVEQGMGVNQVAVGLKRMGLIRSTGVFETYIRSSELTDKIQAGTYTLKPSMSVQQVVDKLVKGEVTKNLLTILPGKRLDQIKKTFSTAGYSEQEISQAFDPATHAGHPALAFLPKGASLEGYLYPDSFQRQTNTPAEVIVRQSLDEMQKYLTPEIINGFIAQGRNVHEGITLASVVHQETDDPAYQPTVSQVFLLRLKKDMKLESDATYVYVADMNNQPRDAKLDSPYNTYVYKGLPPGPIGNFTSSAMQAVAKPASSDYLFFVSGDDNKTYFSRTIEQHQSNVKQYCKKNCGQ